MEPLGWGILGVSRHYLRHVHLPLRDNPAMQVVAVGSRDKARAEEAAAAWGAERAYGSYEEVLADRDVEAVYIPLPNHLHAEWTMKAADAGKHVLCEKPFAMNAAEAEKTVRHCRAKGILVMEAFMYGFHPQWKRIRDLLDTGEIGEVRSVLTRFSYDNRDPRNIRNIAETGGGALYDIGCYAVSSARFIFGREPERVLSSISRDGKFGTDELTSAILDFGRGRAVFTVSTQCQAGQRIDIFGSSGSIEIPLPFNMYPDVPTIVTVIMGQGTRTLSFGAEDMYGTLFEEFRRSVREKRPVPVPPEDATANMKVIDALFRSEKTGTWERP